MRVVGVVLAGGLARRMGGGDKALLPFADGTLLDAVLAAVAGQTGALCLNANGDPARFGRFGLPVVPDPLPGNPGPLAGILAGLDWAAASAESASHLLSVPCDAPRLPPDLAFRLAEPIAAGWAEMTCARSRGRAHPVIGLWPLDCRFALRQALEREGLRKVDRFTARYSFTAVEFPAAEADPFFNANRPEDLERG